MNEDTSEDTSSENVPSNIENELATIREDIVSIKAMLIELLELKNEVEEAFANFQPPNIMKMIGGMLGGNGGGMDLPRLPKR